MLLLLGGLLHLLHSNMTNHLTTLTKAFPLIATWIFSHISTVLSGMCIEMWHDHGGKFFLQDIARIGWIQVYRNYLGLVIGNPWKWLRMWPCMLLANSERCILSFVWRHLPGRHEYYSTSACACVHVRLLWALWKALSSKSCIVWW